MLYRSDKVRLVMMAYLRYVISETPVPTPASTEIAKTRASHILMWLIDLQIQVIAVIVSGPNPPEGLKDIYDNMVRSRSMLLKDPDLIDRLAEGPTVEEILEGVASETPISTPQPPDVSNAVTEEAATPTGASPAVSVFERLRSRNGEAGPQAGPETMVVNPSPGASAPGANEGDSATPAVSGESDSEPEGEDEGAPSGEEDVGASDSPEAVSP